MAKKVMQVDLSTDAGEPNVLRAIAGDLADRLGMDADAIQAEMRDKDKKGHVEVFKKYFGEHVQIFED